MSYRLDDFGNIVKEYITEEGNAGVLVVSLPVLASRMALLGLEDPGAGVDAVSAELDLPVGQEPPLVDVVAAAESVSFPEDSLPLPLVRRMASVEMPDVPVPTTPEELLDHPVVAEARHKCLAALPMALGPDGAEATRFKDELRERSGLELEALRRDYLKQLIPRQRG